MYYRIEKVGVGDLCVFFVVKLTLSNNKLFLRFPDKDVGQYPMAYVVRKAESDLSGKAIMNFVAKQVTEN